jgi:hypothetical protein
LERVACTGKCYYVLALALFQFIECGMLLLIILKCKVEGFLAYVLLDLTLVMLFLPVIYFLLYWKNKKIVMSRNEITYYPILGKVRTYSWNDVRKVRYASGGRGSKGRIIIVTDKTISIEKDMKQFALIEKMIKEKGYLQVKIK